MTCNIQFENLFTMLEDYEINTHFEGVIQEPVIQASIASEMSLSNQCDDTLFHVMSFLDFLSIRLLSVCSKKFEKAALNQTFWQLKLWLDHKKTGDKDKTFYVSYKDAFNWSIKVSKLTEMIWVYCCERGFPPELKDFLQQTLLTSDSTLLGFGRRVWDKLKKGPFEVPETIILVIDSSIFIVEGLTSSVPSDDDDDLFGGEVGYE